MTKLITSTILALLLCASLPAKDLGISGSGATPITAASTTIPGRMTQLTLLFSTDFVGTITESGGTGTCVSGIAGQCAANIPAVTTITFTAGVGNTLNSTVVTRSAGSFEYFRVQ